MKTTTTSTIYLRYKCRPLKELDHSFSFRRVSFICFSKFSLFPQINTPNSPFDYYMKHFGTDILYTHIYIHSIVLFYNIFGSKLKYQFFFCQNSECHEGNIFPLVFQLPLDTVTYPYKSTIACKSTSCPEINKYVLTEI